MTNFFLHGYIRGIRDKYQVWSQSQQHNQCNSGQIRQRAQLTNTNTTIRLMTEHTDATRKLNFIIRKILFYIYFNKQICWLIEENVINRYVNLTNKTVHCAFQSRHTIDIYDWGFSIRRSQLNQSFGCHHQSHPLALIHRLLLQSVRWNLFQSQS